MDDKEKEKFGVIIDKNDQNKDDQSSVAPTPDTKQEVTPSNEETSTTSENIQPEGDKINENISKEDNSNENDNNKEQEVKSESPLVENTTQRTEEKKEHQVIHKKDGRLHIYVRQDKYKGELKSKNWVGRLYIDGKQKISSSGTPDLEKAIPILEKWFDDVHAQKEKEQKELEQKSTQETDKQTQPQNLETTSKETIATDTTLQTKKDDVPLQETVNKEAVETKTELENNTSLNQTEITNSEEQSKVKNFLNKFKDIKFKAPSFGKKDSSSPKMSFNKNKVKEKFNNFLKSRLGKKTAQGEEIVGVEITNKEIRLTQISSNKANQWVLERFYVHPINLPEDAAIVDHEQKVGDELNVALQKSKITTPNAAIAIPVTNAIIRVVTAPLMNDEELKKAIDTNSLWENLVQLTDNLDDYSIFHQVINRNSKDNTMDILFVASKLSDVNAYSAIAKKAGLNPVIIDVKCFTLKNAHDNSKFKTITEKNASAILEIGLEENYLMIIHNNTPIITDVFLRQPEKDLMNSIDGGAVNNESDAVIRRYAMQIKQALADYEGKYESKITNLQIVSSLKNIQHIIPSFKKNLPNLGFNLFDPLDGVAIPSYNAEKTTLENRSNLASVLGLAYRKLDVFGYYKFVTAVKNINLLPNREAIRQKGRLKFLSGFAAKGLAGGIAALYLILIVLSFFQYNSNKDKLVNFDQVQMEYDQENAKFSKLIKRKREIDKSLELGKQISSNQIESYRALAQITRSVPLRVNFTKMKFDGTNTVIIEGVAFSDQDILNFISNLNAKPLIEQASLANMTVNTESGGTGSNNKKGFTINCILKAN